MSNVLDYGAVGDGLTDDTAAIQHAINDGDGAIEFPRGTYLISKSLIVELAKVGRTSLHGHGGVAKIVMAGSGPAIRLEATHSATADPAGFRPDEWQNERMPTIDGLEIEGRHAEADGILIVGVMQATLTRVLVREVRTAVEITKRARNVLIDSCHFYNNTNIGVYLHDLNLHQTIIADSHISYCRRGGIRIENSEIRNLQITGNDIEYNNYRAFAKRFPNMDIEGEATAEIYIDVGEKGTVREGTIASNTIQATYSSNGANIWMIGGGPDGKHKAGMWTITGNLIGSQCNNIRLQYCRGVNITGNYIYSGHHRNVLIEHSRNIVLGSNTIGHNPDYNDKEVATGIRIADSFNCNLTGNLIQDAETGTHTIKDSVPLVRDALVEIVRCQRMNITGCQILDGTPIGLLIDECEDVLVASNTICDQRQAKKTTHGIVFRGKGSGNLCAQNRVDGSVKPIEAGEHVRLQLNYVNE